MKKLLPSLCVCLLLWCCGLFFFTLQIPATPSDDLSKADAIVVLTGGSNRIEYGLQLLAQGVSSTLFITGVQDVTTVSDLIDHNATPQLRKKLAGLTSHIVLGHEAENTIGNAEETRRWIGEQHISTIRLVTSNYHMPRSLKEFNAAMPELTFLPTPVMPDDFSMSNWWQTPTGRALVLSEYHKYIAATVRHFLITFMHRHP